MTDPTEAVLLGAGVPPEAARALAALALPAVRLEWRPIEDEDVAVAVSRLGGLPDVASGFQWPRWKDRPMAFVGQVNLADVAAYPFCASVLPPAGLLRFFYDQEQETWGFDPKDRGSWYVHFEPDPSRLRPMPPEEAPVQPYRVCGLTPSETVTLPPADSDAVIDLALPPAIRDSYWRALESLAEASPGPIHQLLGHPAPVQGDMQLECQLASNGLYVGDPSGYQDPRAAVLRPGAGRWRLLLQVDTDDDAEMMWGDCGRLYFWLTEDALQRRAFGESWMVLQCS